LIHESFGESFAEWQNLNANTRYLLLTLIYCNLITTDSLLKFVILTNSYKLSLPTNIHQQWRSFGQSWDEFCEGIVVFQAVVRLDQLLVALRFDVVPGELF
jgi:hypothetical protein